MIGVVVIHGIQIPQTGVLIGKMKKTITVKSVPFLYTIRGIVATIKGEFYDFDAGKRCVKWNSKGQTEIYT